LFTAPSASSSSGPRSAEDIERDVKSYCRYVSAVGDSTAALLLSPSLFAEFSNIPASGVLTGTSSDTLARLQLGLAISPTRIYRGFVTDDLARAECQRYSAEARTPPLPAAPITSRAAFTAKIQVLEEAVRHGHELRATLAKKLEASLATVEDYGALALQVDGLEQQLSDAKTQLAALPPPPSPANSSAWAARVRAEDAAQDLQGRLRTSQALNLEIRGGYYKIFGQQERVPAFVIATLEFNPGWLWQSSAEARARAAHTAWVKTKNTIIGLAPEVRTQLQATLQADRDRLTVLNDALSDMERRQASVQAVPGEQAQRYADVLWLELAKLRAEKAYLIAHSSELQTVLGGEGPRAR